MIKKKEGERKEKKRFKINYVDWFISVLGVALSCYMVV